MFETPEVVYTDSKFPVIVATDLSGYDELDLNFKGQWGQ